MAELDFNELYATYSQRMHQIAYSIIKDSYLAEDIVQESFLKAFNKMDTIQDLTKVGAWLSAVARRTAIDFVRGEQRKRWLPADQTVMEQKITEKGVSESTEKKFDFILLQEDVREALFGMAPDYRKVMILRVDFGLKEPEIASRLNLKSATVRTRLYRARKQLRKAMLEKYPA
ncbi:RNA polymerase sigma factor [Neobacillus notoginsengisoli]|uniref:RNA polymerase sigma factor n=1 Tax=Neobacillus notoginsengisoli TaxID=1578198 RepID=A0A417YS38_9BACI|nr:RNA polymerase sigma factor [Neobacillus notoginsengisoli]RHW38099.1 RNA polymerase sigma factor [Neobacillus notoginsengisoli]